MAHQSNTNTAVGGISLKVVHMEAFPVRDAVITQGRGSKEGNENTWGLRPKMKVVFQSDAFFGGDFPHFAQYPMVSFRGTVQLLPTVLQPETQEYSYQETKYFHNLPNNEYWNQQFQMEQSKWKYPTLQNFQEFEALRTYRRLSSGKHTFDLANTSSDQNDDQYFEFDYYPCSFLLAEGLTHTKMELQLKWGSCDDDYSVSKQGHEKNATSIWSTPFHWNATDNYNDELSRQQILERIEEMKRDGLQLDFHTRSLDERLRKWSVDHDS